MEIQGRFLFIFCFIFLVKGRYTWFLKVVFYVFVELFQCKQVKLFGFLSFFNLTVDAYIVEGCIYRTNAHMRNVCGLPGMLRLILQQFLVLVLLVFWCLSGYPLNDCLKTWKNGKEPI